MKISVVIPVRNEGAAFPLTLRFFAKLQQHFELEVIVLDDASDPPVVDLPAGTRLVRHNWRQGIARSRNAAARRATGDILLQTDGHVFFSAPDLNRLIEAVDDHTIIGARTQLINDFSQFERRQTDSLNAPDYYGWRWAFAPELSVVAVRTPPSTEPHDVPFTGCACLAMRRQLFETLGGFDGGLFGCGNFEDADLALRAWALGYRVRMLPSVTCYHYTASQPAPNGRGRSPLDLPRYDGSLCNALRILRRHLPTARFEMLTAQLAKQFPESWSDLPAAFVTQLSSAEAAQSAWEPRRVRSREWVVRKMLGEEP